MSRGFFITRAATTGDLDPCALQFYPAKGSDELHEALKEAYPLASNLQSRMRQAVIDFLLQEQQEEQLQQSSVSALSNRPSRDYLPSPQSSLLSTGPSSIASPTPSASVISMSRCSRPSTGVPAQQDLMDVWSLPSKPQAKVHTRRTMTAEERKAYKTKRQIGACVDCKRRRRKCHHNSTTSTSPLPASSSAKTKKQKRDLTSSTQSFHQMGLNSLPPDPLAAAPVAIHSTSTVQPSEQDFLLLGNDLDLAGLSGDMSFMATDFNLNASADFNLGFELDTDFPLFPDYPPASDIGTPITPDWFGTGSMYYGTPFFDNSLQSAISDGFVGSLETTSHALPPSPRSMSITPLLRTESRNNSMDLAALQSSSDSIAESYTAASFQSTSPLSLSDSSLSFIADAPVFAGVAFEPGRHDQRHVPSQTGRETGRETTGITHLPLQNIDDLGRNYELAVQRGDPQSSLRQSDSFDHEQVTITRRRLGRSRPPTSSGFSLASCKDSSERVRCRFTDAPVFAEQVSLAIGSSAEVSRGETALQQNTFASTSRTTAVDVNEHVGRHSAVAGRDYYATAQQTASIDRRDSPPSQLCSLASPFAVVIPDHHVQSIQCCADRDNARLTIALPHPLRNLPSPGPSNADPRKLLRPLATANTASAEFVEHIQRYTSIPDSATSLLMLGCLSCLRTPESLTSYRPLATPVGRWTMLSTVTAISVALLALIYTSYTTFVWGILLSAFALLALSNLAISLVIWVLADFAFVASLPRRGSHFSATYSYQCRSLNSSRDRSRSGSSWTSLSTLLRQGVCNLTGRLGQSTSRRNYLVRRNIDVMRMWL